MDNWQEFIEIIGKSRLKENNLAKLYIEVERIDDLIKIVKEARIHRVPAFIIGTGSRASIPRSQINGLMIKNNCHRFDVFGIKGKIKERNLGVEKASVYAESGTNINQLVRFTIEKGLSGLEYHLGMPGTIGGAIYTNSRYTPKKIYICDAVEKIKIINKEGDILEVSGDYFASRDNNEFSQSDAIILSAVFSMHPEDKKILWEKGNEAAVYRKNLNFTSAT
ncbi:FAD-binding protein [Patescibacteria group bacterium]|nr:FAD-binding protein [Patescibacteria group bacterium]MBU4017415.1 FAD-binding protein [Patescibacteria group bacterium]MBU4098917.1 FAD-binding protein [Patescibacteria group bacterium]